MKKVVKTFEEFIGDKKLKYSKTKLKHSHGKEVFSIKTNTSGKKYDQEDDGSDQITGSTLNF